MKPRRALRGQAPIGLYRSRSDNGKDAEPGQTIFPIVTQRNDGTFVPIGTGFFVAEQGVFVTAAHVVTEVLDQAGNPTGPFGLFQFLPGGTYHLRPIHRVTRHLVADVAIGVAVPMHHNVTGAPIRNKVLKISRYPPPLGSGVCTFAYPKTTVMAGKPQRIHFEPAFFDGNVIEHFPDGRDRVVLPGPCFRTSMVIHGGASGGPVIDEHGAAFAVNSTGFDDDDVSYVSCISAVLDLDIPDFKLPGDESPRSTTLRELLDRGFAASG